MENKRKIALLLIIVMIFNCISLNVYAMDANNGYQSSDSYSVSSGDGTSFVSEGDMTTSGGDISNGDSGETQPSEYVYYGEGYQVLYQVINS